MRGAIPVDTAQGNDGQLWQYMLGAGRINPYRSLTQWGRIRSDTTWASFAYVSGDIKIDEGKTLTIEPGTTIYFAPEDNDNTYDPTVVEFRVDGTLIAEGTESNPIVFKSLSQDPQPGDWSGLQIIGTAASASLAYCDVSDGFMGVKSKRPVEVSHCNISNCQIFGIYLLDSGANGSEISDCTMTGNGGSGIWIYSSDNVSVSGCTCDNNPRGIWLGSSTGSSIQNTVLKSSLTDGLKASDGSSIMINGCTIESNGQQGIYLSNSNASISHTKIWKNTANGLYCTGALSNPEVEYSKIEQNAVGVRAISPACPILGDIERSIGQYNAIYNQPLFVYGHHDCLIMAENCWWGTKPGKPPSLSKFLGDVDYYPWLDSDPVPYLAPSAPQKSTTLSLAQNFPNPSVGSGITRISYSIPSGNENTRVLLAIYDVTGRRIRTLVDEAKGTGTYQAYWDGKGDRGKTAAPGIYFYKLTVGKSSISKKLILFR
jgi:parallel beta-helix repeat protein